MRERKPTSGTARIGGRGDYFISILGFHSFPSVATPATVCSKAVHVYCCAALVGRHRTERSAGKRGILFLCTIFSFYRHFPPAPARLNPSRRERGGEALPRMIEEVAMERRWERKCRGARRGEASLASLHEWPRHNNNDTAWRRRPRLPGEIGLLFCGVPSSARSPPLVLLLRGKGK